LPGSTPRGRPFQNADRDRGHYVQGGHPHAALGDPVHSAADRGRGEQAAGDPVLALAGHQLLGAPLDDGAELALNLGVALDGGEVGAGGENHLRVVADHLVVLDAGDVPPAARRPADPDHDGWWPTVRAVRRAIAALEWIQSGRWRAGTAGRLSTG
jgi:hypothetical protein